MVRDTVVSVRHANVNSNLVEAQDPVATCAYQQISSAIAVEQTTEIQFLLSLLHIA